MRFDLQFHVVTGLLFDREPTVIALGIGIFEIYKVVTDEGGRRWGDTLADTKVIEVDA